MPMRYMMSAVLLAAVGAGQQPARELRIVKPLLRQYEDGPALAPTQDFGAGETVFLTFQVQGYKPGPDKRIHLQWSVEVFDGGGVRLVEPAAKDLQAELSPEDKDWMPIVRHTFPIPPILLPGEYRIAARVADKVGGGSARAELPLHIRARKVELSDTLTARTFRFLRSENEFRALEPATYRPGDTVWARFDIVGYKFGDANRIEVEYRISIATGEGKILFSQPQPAVEQRESFYPQKYVPGVVSVTTQTNTRPGEYLLILSLRDQVGNQAAEEKHAFRIE